MPLSSLIPYPGPGTVFHIRLPAGRQGPGALRAPGRSAGSSQEQEVAAGTAPSNPAQDADENDDLRGPTDREAKRADHGNTGQIDEVMYQAREK
jgi:hypothetical protein